MCSALFHHLLFLLRPGVMANLHCQLGASGMEKSHRKTSSIRLTWRMSETFISCLLIDVGGPAHEGDAICRQMGLTM